MNKKFMITEKHKTKRFFFLCFHILPDFILGKLIFDSITIEIDFFRNIFSGKLKRKRLNCSASMPLNHDHTLRKRKSADVSDFLSKSSSCDKKKVVSKVIEAGIYLEL